MTSPIPNLISLINQTAEVKGKNEKTKLTIQAFQGILDNFAYVAKSDKFLNVTLAKARELAETTEKDIEPAVYQQLFDILQKTADTIKEYRASVGKPRVQVTVLQPTKPNGNVFVVPETVPAIATTIKPYTTLYGRQVVSPVRY